MDSQQVFCNMCGEKPNQKKGFSFESDRFKNFTLSFGYGSKYDTETWSFGLCEDCLVKVISKFKYAPDGFFINPYFKNIIDQEKHQDIFDYWKETGEWHEFMSSSYKDLVNLKGFLDISYINKLIKRYYPDKPLIEVDKSD